MVRKTWSNNKHKYIVWPHLQTIIERIVILTKYFDLTLQSFYLIKQSSGKMQPIYDTFKDISFSLFNCMIILNATC